MSKEKSFVSVLIPAYNHEKYIQETIKSIIHQTYQNIELIIVDDGSKDLTWHKIQEMKEECEKRFSRVIFETKENEGTCKTLNKLLSLAQGEYIYLIASDDLAKPQAVETEVKFLKTNLDYALVVGDNEIIDGNSQVCYWDENKNNVYDINESKYKTFGDFLKQYKKDVNFYSKQFGSYKTLYIGNYIPNGYLIRKSIFDKIGFFTPEAPLEDYWLMLQISKYSNMKYIDEVLFSYRWHNSNTVKNREKMIKITEKTLEYEEKLVKSLKSNKYIDPIVFEIHHYGLCYKKQGIPFVFEIVSYKKETKKTKILKIFNIKIFTIIR